MAVRYEQPIEERAANLVLKPLWEIDTGGQQIMNQTIVQNSTDSWRRRKHDRDLRDELKQKQADGKALERRVAEQEEKNKLTMQKNADTRNAYPVISAVLFRFSDTSLVSRQTTSFNDFSIEAGILLRGVSCPQQGGAGVRGKNRTLGE